MSEQDIAGPDMTRRKVKALLVTGLVLGTGCAMTLAVWNSSINTSASFASGYIGLVGSSDNQNWSTPGSLTPGTLTFSANVNSMSPNDVVAAPYAIALANGSTNSATVSIQTPTATGVNTGNLSYQLLQMPTFGCAGTPIATLVPAGTQVNSAAGAQSFTLSSAASNAQGTSAFLCFKMTAGNSLQPSSTENVTWKFNAESMSN